MAMNGEEGARDAIAAVLAEQEAAWNRGDAEGFAAAALPGLVFTNVIGMFSVGRAPFVAQHAHIFATIYKGSRMRQELQHIAFVRPDVAIVDTLCVLGGTAALPPGIQTIDGAVHARLEQVMVREDGAWQVASFHNVAVQPSAGHAAPS